MRIAIASRLVLWTLAALLVGGSTASGQVRLKSICRVKGQERNTLRGLGIVTGLKGTGDSSSFLPTIRSLAQAMELMGNPIGKGGPVELKDVKNVALVTVTATIGEAGGLQGDEIDCTVSSIGGAKTLAGGRLFMTPLQGPQVESTRVYAFAEGPIHLDDPDYPTSGKIHRGCRLEENFRNAFSKDGKITLVLNEHKADFELTQEIAELINSQLSYQGSQNYLARAINQLYVEVAIPPAYRDEPNLFVSQVLGLTVAEPQTSARVVINERSGSVVIDADVEIGAVAVTHKNIVIETGGGVPAERFIGVAPGATQSTKLKSLVEALNAVKVPTEDIIEIIKGLDRDGKLHGHLVLE